MSAKPQEVQVWSVEGLFQHLIYSPKGTVEGVMIDSAGAPVQFVIEGPFPAALANLLALQPGQSVVMEGTVAPHSPKGEADHEVFHLERLVSIDGRPAPDAPPLQHITGTVVRFNYARHGSPNGVVLDTGDFIHTKPDGFQRLALKVGDKVRAEGPTRHLSNGHGQVVEAHTINDRRLDAAR
jgi:hypothetical protein